MHEAIEVYRTSVLAFIIALCFVLLKRLVEKRRPALEDTRESATSDHRSSACRWAYERVEDSQHGL